jgi:hypothetical protein
VATKKQIEDAIFAREGFRVEFDLFEGKKSALPPYDFTAMAPQRWRISDWKNVRLEPYRLMVKAVKVYRGDGETVARDLQLGNLRDSYYEAGYGPIRRASAEEEGEKVVDLASRRKKSTTPG